MHPCLLFPAKVEPSSLQLKHSVLTSNSFQEIHGLIRKGVSVDNISSQLSPWASALFEFLPPFIRKQVYFLIISCLYIHFDLTCCTGSHLKYV